MEIRNNFTQSNNLPSFGAIKMVKCSNADVKNLVGEMKVTLALEPHHLFKGKSPLYSDLANTIAIQAEKMNRSSKWLIENARLHGINIPDTNIAPLFDVTGKDMRKLCALRLKNLINIIFYRLKNKNKPEIQSLPEHLKTIKILNDFADKQQAAFDKFLKKNNAQEMDFPHYLTSLITNLL